MLSNYEKSNIARVIQSGDFGLRKGDVVLILFLCSVVIVAVYQAVWLEGVSLWDFENKNIRHAALYALWAFVLYMERRYRMAINYASKFARGEVKSPSCMHFVPMAPISALILGSTLLLWISWLLMVLWK